MDYVKFDTLCKNNGTTPSKLVRKLGLSKGNTTSWRNGGNPSVEILIKLSDELNCTVDELLGREMIESSGNRYNDIHNIGDGVTIGEHNTFSNNVSQNALEFDKILSTLDYRKQIKLMSLIYEWIDELKD